MSEQSGQVDLSVCQVGDECHLRRGDTAPFRGANSIGWCLEENPYQAGEAVYRQDGTGGLGFEPEFDIVRVTRNGKQITPPVRVMKENGATPAAGLWKWLEMFADNYERDALNTFGTTTTLHRKDIVGQLRTIATFLRAAQPAATGEGEEAADPRLPRCGTCDKIAECIGVYDGVFAYACGDCCGHGSEDGKCELLAENPKAFDEMAALAIFQAVDDATDKLRQELETRPSAPPSPPAETEEERLIRKVNEATDAIDSPSPPQRAIQLWEEPKPIVLEDPVDMAAAMPGDACLRRDGKWVDFECTKPEREFCPYVAGGLRYTRTGGHWRDTISDKDIIRIMLRPRVAQVNAAGGKAVNNV